MSVPQSDSALDRNRIPDTSAAIATRPMSYQIEADWHLLNTCNYRCGYCFFSAEVLGEKLKTFAAPEEWRQAFDSSGMAWLLHLTGGEPSIYPQFNELCETLTRNHFISINSNLANRAWETFPQRVDPTRVTFINAGLHLEERQRRAGNTAYLDNVALLRDGGFHVICSLVATPNALARFEEAIQLLDTIGMFPVPKVQRGIFEGKRYPDAYSDLDRMRFREYSAMARAFYAPILAGRPERPTLDMFGDDSVLDREPTFSGLSCDAGRLFVRIDPRGEVFRCGTTDSLGNVRARTFARTAGPAPCATSYCFYFCRKYTSTAKTALSAVPTV